MMVMGIVLVWFSALMFVYLELGEAINRILGTKFTLFRCVKCATFWAVLIYSLFCADWSVEASLAVAFGGSYAALWMELLLDILADKYEEFYKGVEPKDTEDDER